MISFQGDDVSSDEGDAEINIRSIVLAEQDPLLMNIPIDSTLIVEAEMTDWGNDNEIQIDDIKREPSVSNTYSLFFFDKFGAGVV